MNSAKRLAGGCLCGNIRFETKTTPARPHSCSCRMCQRHSGALALCWVEFDANDVEWTGPGGKPATWRSSAGSSRAFCPQCGSTLGAIDDLPIIALVTGAFDKPHLLALKPNYHSFKSAKPRWWHVSAEG